MPKVYKKIVYTYRSIKITALTVLQLFFSTSISDRKVKGKKYMKENCPVRLTVLKKIGLLT